HIAASAAQASLPMNRVLIVCLSCVNAPSFTNPLMVTANIAAHTAPAAWVTPIGANDGLLFHRRHINRRTSKKRLDTRQCLRMELHAALDAFDKIAFVANAHCEHVVRQAMLVTICIDAVEQVRGWVFALLGFWFSHWTPPETYRLAAGQLLCGHKLYQNNAALSRCL